MPHVLIEIVKFEAAANEEAQKVADMLEGEGLEPPRKPIGTGMVAVDPSNIVMIHMLPGGHSQLDLITGMSLESPHPITVVLEKMRKQEMEYAAEMQAVAELASARVLAEIAKKADTDKGPTTKPRKRAPRASKHGGAE